MDFQHGMSDGVVGPGVTAAGSELARCLQRWAERVVKLAAMGTETDPLVAAIRPKPKLLLPAPGPVEAGGRRVSLLTCVECHEFIEADGELRRHVCSGRKIAKTTPSVKTSPIVKKTSPIVKKTSPIVKKTSPIVKKTSPIVKKSSPNVKTSSTVETCRTTKTSPIASTLNRDEHRSKPKPSAMDEDVVVLSPPPEAPEETRRRGLLLCVECDEVLETEELLSLHVCPMDSPAPPPPPPDPVAQDLWLCHICLSRLPSQTKLAAHSISTHAAVVTGDGGRQDAGEDGLLTLERLLHLFSLMNDANVLADAALNDVRR